jgi:hypothetical protein
MPWNCEFWLKTFQEPGNFWAMMTAVTTVVLAWVAYRQLSDLARTSKSDFLYKLKKDFFTEETRRLIFLIENQLLEFRSAEVPYFQVIRPANAEMQSRFEELGIVASTVSTYLVDDCLLGPLEDLGVLAERNLVSLDEAYEQFVTYVEICAESRAIREYLDWSSSQDPNDDDVYDHFQKLYERLRSEGSKIRARKRNARR